MKADKLQTTLEKQIEKIKNIDFNFSDDSMRVEFDEMKNDIISLMENMIDMAHDDEQNDLREEQEED